MKPLSVQAFVLFILVNSSFSEIRRVPQDYVTIQTAIDSCSIGDTILVDKGSYSERMSINKSMTIFGIEKDSVVIYSQITIKASNVNVQKLTISTYYDSLYHYYFSPQVIIDSSSNVKIAGLYLPPHNELDIPTDGGNNMTISASKGVSLISVIMQAGDGGPGSTSHLNQHASGNGGSGIIIANSQSIVIDSCTIYGGNAGYRAYYYVAPGKTGSPLILKDSSVVSVSNSKLKYEVVKDSSSSILLTNTTIILTDVFETEPSNSTPSRYQLRQNYPNPFNPSTNISFSLPSKSVVSVNIYDITGRKVATLVNEELAAGNYVRHWNAANMPSGIYFYRMQAGTFRDTKKLMLLR